MSKCGIRQETRLGRVKYLRTFDILTRQTHWTFNVNRAWSCSTVDDAAFVCVKLLLGGLVVDLTKEKGFVV